MSPELKAVLREIADYLGVTCILAIYRQLSPLSIYTIDNLLADITLLTFVFLPVYRLHSTALLENACKWWVEYFYNTSTLTEFTKNRIYFSEQYRFKKYLGAFLAFGIF